MPVQNQISLPVWGKTPITLRPVQGEAQSRTIITTLIDVGGQPVNLATASVRLYVQKPDSTVVFTDGTIEDAAGGMCSFTLPSGVTAVAGIANCQILVTWLDNRSLKVIGLVLEILPSNLDGAVESSNEFSALVTALIKIDSAVQQSQINWLLGKTINVFGDSQSDPVVTPNAWPTLLPNLIGVTVNNYAKSGTMITGDAGWAATISNYSSDADVNVVMLGINDFWNNKPLGQYDSTSNNEFIGAVKNLLSYIAAHWPNSINYVIFNTPVESNTGGKFGMDRLYQWIEYKIAKYYGFLVIDTHSCLPNYNPQVPQWKTAYCPDGMHPNSAYEPILADIISRYLKEKRSDVFAP